MDTAWKERNSCALFDSPFCLSLHYAFETEDKLISVFELKPGITLRWRWPHNKKFPNNIKTKAWLAAMALGVKEMKDKNVVHLDGHPDNMMTDELGYPVWIDFGCSQTGITEPDKGGSWHIIGWPGGHIPETRENQRNGKKQHGYMSDWYIYGHYFYSALAGHRMDHKSREADVECKAENEKHIKKDAKDIIRKLTEFDPLKRLGINGWSDIRDHPFFKEIDWEKVQNREYDLSGLP